MVKIDSLQVAKLSQAEPGLRALFIRWARMAAKGESLPASFTVRGVGFGGQRDLESLLMTRTSRTTDGKVRGSLPPTLREPSAWHDVIAELGMPALQAEPESVADFLLRLEWLHPEVAVVLEDLKETPEVVRHLSKEANRTGWKTLFESVLRMGRHLPDCFMTLSQLGSDWFNDSKALRSGPLRRQLVLIIAAFAHIGADDEKNVLSAWGIEPNPYTSSVTVFAPFVFWLDDGTCFDYPLKLYEKGLVCQLPAETVLKMSRVEWQGEKKLATSENAAPILRFVETGRPVLYTEGYPNCAVLNLMRLLAECGVVAVHWGDADLDGFRIANLVCGNMPGSSVAASRVLETPGDLPGIPLSSAQRRRVERFIGQHPSCAYLGDLNRLLDRGRWYEQESFPSHVL